MGLFDTIFGSSSNMQKWHMRDKVKDHKYFERQLERNLQSKVITEQALIESVESNNNQIDRTFKKRGRERIAYTERTYELMNSPIGKLAYSPVRQ